MNFRKVKGVFQDWMQGGYRFGFYFSDSVAAKLDVAPKSALVGGAVFDVAAGGGLTYLAATQAIGTVIGAAMAVASIATAPVTAVVTVAVGVVFLALDCMMGGIGLGLLNAARIKCGISSPAYLARKTKATVARSVESTGDTFKAGAKKLSACFQKAKKPAAKTAPNPASPKGGQNFDL